MTQRVWLHFVCAPIGLVGGNWSESPARHTPKPCLLNGSVVLPSLGLCNDGNIYIGFLKLNTLDCDSSATDNFICESFVWHTLLEGRPMDAVSGNSFSEWPNVWPFFAFHFVHLWISLLKVKGRQEGTEKASSIVQVSTLFLIFWRLKISQKMTTDKWAL